MILMKMAHTLQSTKLRHKKASRKHERMTLKGTNHDHDHGTGKLTLSTSWQMYEIHSSLKAFPFEAIGRKQAECIISQLKFGQGCNLADPGCPRQLMFPLRQQGKLYFNFYRTLNGHCHIVFYLFEVNSVLKSLLVVPLPIHKIFLLNQESEQTVIHNTIICGLH